MLCLLYLVCFCTQGSDSEGPVDKLTLLGMQTWALYQERIPSNQASLPAVWKSLHGWLLLVFPFQKQLCMD